MDSDLHVHLISALQKSGRITYWVDQDASRPEDQSDIAAKIGLTADKNGQLLDMIEGMIGNDAVHCVREQVDPPEDVKFSPGSKQPRRIIYTLTTY